MMQKNVAGQKIGCQMVSATDGSAFTSAVTVYVTGDAGTQSAGSVGSGACTHEGNGYHTYAPAQAETNYDLVAFTFIGTGAVPATVQVFTSFPQTGDAYARLGAPAGASVSADVAAVKAQTAAIETDTQDLQTQVGTDGAGLTNLPWNAAWDAEVQSEAADAITAAALATATNLATLAGYVDTEVAAILAAVDTEVAAIKTKTDYLPSATAGAAGGLFIAGANAATSITTALTANITGNLSGSVGSVTGNVGGSVASVAANGIAATSIASDAINAAAIKADAVTKIQTGLATPTNITAGTITTVTNLTNLPAAAALEATAQAILTDTGTTLPGTLATIAGYIDTEVAAILAAVDTEVAAILADTNELQTDWADGGRLDLLLDAAGGAGDPWTTALPGAYGAGTAGKIIGDNIDAAVSSRAAAGDEMDLVDAPNATAVAAIADAVLLELVGDHSNTDGSLAQRIDDILTAAENAYNQSITILTAIGGWDGIGDENIRGYLLAIMSKTANTPYSVGGTFDPATDSIEAISEAVATAIDQQDVADALLLAPSGAAASGSAMDVLADILEDTGTTIPAAIAGIGGLAGSGAISFPVTINDEDSNPIDGVEVWVTTDSAGTNVVAGTLSTDALGLATFMLDAGTYYVWRQKSGYNFTNPVSVTVS